MSVKRIVLFSVTALTMGVGAPSASAATAAPGLTIDSFAMPTNFSASQNADCINTVTRVYLGSVSCDAYQVTVTNAGGEPTVEGDPITITDALPEGLVVHRVSLFGSGEANLGEADCTRAPLRCKFSEVLAPDGKLRMVVDVTVEPGAAGSLANTASVSGGGAPQASVTNGNAIRSTPASFGPSNFDFYIAGADGALDTEAGGHPYELTTTIGLDNAFRNIGPEGNGLSQTTSVQDVKDIVVDLPLGFAGSTLAAPTCSLAQLSSAEGCPGDTQVGYLITEPKESAAVAGPIYNLVPERGAPAEFGYVDVLHGAHVFYTHVVPTPAGYVLQVTSSYIPQIGLAHIVATFYGDPAVRDDSGNAQVPFFTNPTDCSGGELTATIYMDSWLHPGSYNADGTPDVEGDPNWVKMTSSSPPVTGCDGLQFAPELGAQPTTHQADSPSGLEFELKLPQSEQAEVSATPALRDAVVTLPAGMTVDPSSGNGLGGCSVTQIGWEGGTPQNFDAAPPACPESSKIGSLELTTPLIPGTLTGELFLANQNENPFGSVLAAYVVVNDPVTGVVLKIAGEFKTNPQTGQITSVFAENPQLPFSDLKLHFFGGPRAELTTPESCGVFTTDSELTPWSAPDSGPIGTPFDSFTIDEGCVSGFAPAFTAGTTNLQAGAYTPFVASFSREDTDQELGGLSVNLPPGLLADVTSVPLCPEANANAGTCPESSQVGTVQAGAGPGPNPLFEHGKAFLTGPYNGGPYGLSVVVPAVAGPFNFGNVVVRQSLRIDPLDAHVTDVSNPFPTMLDVTGSNGQTDGIPIKLRRVDVSIDRPGFTFNPTNCSKLQVAGSITSTQGATSNQQTPFQVTNCQTLKFQPTFAVTTSGRTSKANGASLTAKLSYPNAPQGAEANIARVKVDLPQHLPSRLTTLQKACTTAQFDANPAACPAGSKIGYAIVHTPILPEPLSGPAIFVSHGGEAFPSLTMVLQGDGVTVDLVGTTFIHKGITSTTFKTVPDTPFSTFELTLPEGKFSALAAIGDLCKSKLAMPTEFLAQNGAKINESTKIGVTGCPKARKATKRRQVKKGKKSSV